MSLLPDYASQAATYDKTRAASRPVLAALQAAIVGAPGDRLADIGGGTGNYALALEHEGWRPVVIDRSPEMLAFATQKGLATIAAAAERLPVADESFDAAMLVSMLHHVADPSAALAEARRILRPEGRLAVIVFTREDIHDLWFLDYFPSTRPWMHESHQPVAELLTMLPGAQRREIVLDDLKDASLAALAAHPEKVLEHQWRAQTSYFERLQRDNPAELDAGLKQLEADVAAGDATRGAGRASILAWTRAASASPTAKPSRVGTVELRSEQTPIGAVLAGGAGSRIGGSKAMVQLAGRPLISYPVAALLEAGLEPLVVAKATTELPELDAPVVREEPKDSHPLHGIIAALRAANGRPVVVVACDMPLVTARLLAWLGGISGTAIPLAGNVLQPLLARYEAAAAQVLDVAVREGRSARAAALRLNPRVIDESELARFGEPESLLLNVNDERDLARAAALLPQSRSRRGP
jgi:molybdopterin-guanine dinucleotide biosynthesis protein A/ubiquinone/menaquinone biosynthesis C-methylase UbiE